MKDFYIHYYSVTHDPKVSKQEGESFEHAVELFKAQPWNKYTSGHTESTYSSWIEYGERVKAIYEASRSDDE